MTLKMVPADGRSTRPSGLILETVSGPVRPPWTELYRMLDLLEELTEHDPLVQREMERRFPREFGNVEWKDVEEWIGENLDTPHVPKLFEALGPYVDEDGCWALLEEYVTEDMVKSWLTRNADVAGLADLLLGAVRILSRDDQDRLVAALLEPV